MGNTKNLILSVVIVVGFIALWDLLVVSQYGPPASAKKQAAQANQAEKGANSTAVQPANPKATQLPLEVEPVKGPAKKFILKNDQEEITFDSMGAKVVSWKIKEEKRWVELLAPPKPDTKNPNKVFVFPLETFPDLNFAGEIKDDNKIVFAANHPMGFQVRKELRLGSEPWLHSVNLSISNQSNKTLALNTGLGWGEGIYKINVEEGPNEKDLATVRAEIRGLALANKVMSWKPGIIFGRTVDKTVKGAFEWAGIDNDHFLVAFVPIKGAIEEVKVKADKHTAATLQIPLGQNVAPGETAEQSFQLYVGPKIIPTLKAVGFNLDKSINFGFFGFISKALLAGLRYFQGITGNYGWAIVILTVVIQILFYPLTRKSLQHSVKMKELQPQLKKIQKELKHDPKRLQIETFNLYKKNGMKFMGMEGCFPMLLQIPIFFAFYQTLRVAYELRGAPWIFWIQDLAVYDPYYILPILMGLGMFLQQKLTAVAMDPAQAKMMLFMPLMFTFFFFKLPAGLVLYWVVNSIATIFVQKFLQWRKSHSTPKPAAT